MPDAAALVIFQGPDSFISPSWYPSKRENAKVVPTWNYAVVHAHGVLRFVDDPAWVRSHVEALTREHEGKRDSPWAVTDAPADYVDKMVAAVIGIEISITGLVGKWKVSQNRSMSDRVGVVEALERGPYWPIALSDISSDIGWQSGANGGDPTKAGATRRRRQRLESREGQSNGFDFRVNLRVLERTPTLSAKLLWSVRKGSFRGPAAGEDCLELSPAPSADAASSLER